jgi:hypothetical protein
MSEVLNYLKSKRVWVVKNMWVWGSFSLGDFCFLSTQIGETSKRIIFQNLSLGGTEQYVPFDTLYDFKGNRLPSEIANPFVIVMPKNKVSCLVLEETNGGFKIAKRKEEVENGLVDLIVWEMG